jgi:hypothetical protein
MLGMLGMVATIATIATLKCFAIDTHANKAGKLLEISPRAFLCV